jgi:hypothetical protein
MGQSQTYIAQVLAAPTCNLDLKRIIGPSGILPGIEPNPVHTANKSPTLVGASGTNAAEFCARVKDAARIAILTSVMGASCELQFIKLAPHKNARNANASSVMENQNELTTDQWLVFDPDQQSETQTL